MARTKKIKEDKENLELENSGKVSPIKSSRTKQSNVQSSIVNENNIELSTDSSQTIKSKRGRKPKNLLESKHIFDNIETNIKSSSKKSNSNFSTSMISQDNIITQQIEPIKSKRGRKPKTEATVIEAEVSSKTQTAKKIKASQSELPEVNVKSKRGRKPKAEVPIVEAEPIPQSKPEKKIQTKDTETATVNTKSKRGRRPKVEVHVVEEKPISQSRPEKKIQTKDTAIAIVNTKSKRGRKPKVEVHMVEPEPISLSTPEKKIQVVDSDTAKLNNKSKHGPKPKAEVQEIEVEPTTQIPAAGNNTFSVDIEDVKVIRKSKRGPRPQSKVQPIETEKTANIPESDKNTFSVGIRDVRVIKRASDDENLEIQIDKNQDNPQDNTFSVGIRDVRVIRRANEQEKPEEKPEITLEDAKEDNTFSVDLRNVKIIQNAESDFEIESIEQEEEAQIEEKQQFFVNAADIRVVSRARWGHPVYIEIPDKQKKDKKNEFLVDIKDVKVVSSGNNPDVIISPYNESEESIIETEEIIEIENVTEQITVPEESETIVEEKPKLTRWQKFKEKQLKKKLERQAKRLAEKEASVKEATSEETVIIEPVEEPKEIITKKSEPKKSKQLAKAYEAVEEEPIDFSKIEIKYSPKSEFFEQSESKPIAKVKQKVQTLATVNPEKLLRKSDRNDKLIQSIIEKVEEFLVKEMYIDHTSRVLLAVSGGVDSIVLLDCMAVLSDKYKFGLFVAHYNHKLRGEASDKDEQFVKSVCQSYNIPFYSANGKVKQFAEKNSMSIETAARFLRYSYFERTVRTINGDFLATAHTADDSAETFLMNLIRGAGLTGLSGIPSRRQFIKDVLLIRPIITFKKKQIIEYANRRGLDWTEDETNMLQQYTRNKIRHDLIPKLESDFTPSIVDIINRAANLIHGADSLVHTYVKAQLPNVVSEVQPDRFSIKLSIFNTLDDFLQGEIIQTALGKYFRLQAQSLNIIDRIIDLQNSEIGAICEINKKIFAIRERNQITVARKKDTFKVNMLIDPIGKYKIGNYSLVLRKVERAELEFSKNPNVEYIDAASLPPVLYLRNWEPGDSFTPLGMQGTMKVSDYLTNEKISSIDKQGVLVLSTKTEIIWLIGMRLSDKYKVKKNTKNIIKLEFRTNEK